MRHTRPRALIGKEEGRLRRASHSLSAPARVCSAVSTAVGARVFLLAALVRVLLLCTATHLPVLNDVDYDVFTDAARRMVEGGSPYQLASFSYPPL